MEHKSNSPVSSIRKAGSEAEPKMSCLFIRFFSAFLQNIPTWINSFAIGCIDSRGSFQVNHNLNNKVTLDWKSLTFSILIWIKSTSTTKTELFWTESCAAPCVISWLSLVPSDCVTCGTVGVPLRTEEGRLLFIFNERQPCFMGGPNEIESWQHFGIFCFYIGSFLFVLLFVYFPLLFAISCLLSLTKSVKRPMIITKWWCVQNLKWWCGHNAGNNHTIDSGKGKTT